MIKPRLLKALHCEAVDRTPIWIMRQAGRYLPEYQAIRKKVPDFLSLCQTPELACEVTLQPLRRFPLDAAILFSDILVIPDAYGLGLTFQENVGPIFKNPIQTGQDIDRLPTLDPETDLNYVLETIKLIKHELNKVIPLIGFAGSPWTIATYMVEGGGSKHFNRIKRFRYEAEAQCHQLLNHLTQSIIDYLKAQIYAGVDVVMLFDTWGGILSRSDYLNFSLFYMKKIVQGLKSDPHCRDIPVILFSKNSGQQLEEIAATGCSAIGLDWTADLKNAKEILHGKKIALQGNLDPGVLYGNVLQIEKGVKEVLANFGQDVGHIFNLGHGIPPDVNTDAVHILIDSLNKWGRFENETIKVAENISK